MAEVADQRCDGAEQIDLFSDGINALNGVLASATSPHIVSAPTTALSPGD